MTCGKGRSPYQMALAKEKRGKIKALALAALAFVFLSLSAQPVRVEAEIDTQLLSQFDIFEADIRDVFRSLAELGDLNVLLDKDVQGLVTINLKHGLKIGEAIELLARTYGYSYRWIVPRRTIIIGTEKTFTDWETKETRVYPLSYAVSREIVTALGVVIPQDRIGLDVRTNQLTINANALEHQNVEEIIARLDRRMPQISIEARVEEISLTASKDLGVTWDFPHFSIDGSLRFNLLTTQALSAMEENGVARVLANPNISTTDGQEGKIFIGDRLPVITSTIKDGMIEDEVTYIEAGTLLTVEPQINDERTITVKVRAEVSNIIGWRIGATGMEVPVVRTREASSVVRLREGQTFVLSGLNMQQDTETITSVPFASRLPFFGRLFQKQSKEPWEDTEICIFLTPYVVREEEEGLRPGAGKEPAVKEVDLEVVWPDVGTREAAPIELVIVHPEDVHPEGKETPDPREETETREVIETLEIIEIREVTETQEVAETQEVPETVGEPEETAWQELGGRYYDEQVRGVPPVKAVEEQETIETVAGPAKGLTLSYQVQAGDTLSAIGRKYGITPGSILAENKGADILYPGQELVLPIPESHLYPLKAGETIWRLAKRYGTTVELLMEINGITDVTVLKTGRMIILPGPADQIVDDRF